MTTLEWAVRHLREDHGVAASIIKAVEDETVEKNGGVWHRRRLTEAYEALDRRVHDAEAAWKEAHGG